MPVAAPSQAHSEHKTMNALHQPPVSATSDTREHTQNAISSAFSPAEHERLLNAREVAARLGVSERWVRDHTTRRSPKIRGVKLGTLMRYRCADVEEFMQRMTTPLSSLQRQLGG